MMRSILAAVCLAASLSPAFAGAGDLKTIGEQCASQLKLPGAVCNCIVQKAGSDLSGNQQAFMAAQVSGNQAEAARIQSTLTPAQAAATGQFMSAVIAQCGG